LFNLAGIKVRASPLSSESPIIYIEGYKISIYIIGDSDERGDART